MLYLLHLPRLRKRDPKAPEPARRGLRYALLRPRRRLFQAPLVRSRNPTRVTSQLRTKPASPFVGRSFLSGISVLTLRFQLPYRLDDLSLQGFSRFWSTVFPAAPGGAGFASGGQRNAGRCPFSERFRRHFSLRPSAVIEICSALRSPYPAGDGSAAIFRSMPANSRRVRWLSASSSLCLVKT